jgi:hypothetical protein
LEKIVGDINALQEQPRWKRLWKYIKQPELISDMRKELDLALSCFQVCTIGSSTPMIY